MDKDKKLKTELTSQKIKLSPIGEMEPHLALELHRLPAVGLQVRVPQSPLA
jgi:hypothetical protein